MVGLRGLEDGLGGVEKAVKEISTRLVKMGVDVTCYCRSKYNDRKEYEGVKLINNPTIYSKHLETAVYALSSIWDVTFSDYDVVHIHALASSGLAWLPRFIGKKKVVITIHGLDWQRAKWGIIASSILKCGEWSAIKFANSCITVSDSLSTYFQVRYPGKKIFYVPNGCDVQTQSYPNPPLGLESKKYILYLGRIVPEKGVHKLIEAYKGVETDYSLIIAGPLPYSGEYGKTLQELADSDPRVKLVGSVVGEDKSALLQHAYMVVLPSEIEGFPIVALEAASHKTCLAISQIPTSVDVIGDRKISRGFVFDPNSIEQMTNVLSTAVQVPDLVKSLGEQSYEYVQENFSWDNIARHTKYVYENLS